MNYMLELANLSGDGITSEQWSLLESETPLPVPMVGDHVTAQDSDSEWEVVSRNLYVFGDAPTIKYTVFCKPVSPEA
tara:strand:- start:183 stop:413 length:231 start_codon:yes stop_codon:yes gene_type:complete